MSYDYELDTAQTFLPGSYSIDVTANLTGYTPLTRTFVISVDVAQSVDTVRTIVDLLTNIWRDGQGPKELTTRDVRDTIVSLALQTGNFSDLPTQRSDAAFGHVYVSQGILMVNLDTPAINQFAASRMDGSGGIVASTVRRLLGTTLDGGISTFTGSAAVSAGIVFGSANLQGAGSFFLGFAAGSFSSDFSTDFDSSVSSLESLRIFRVSNARLAGSSGENAAATIVPGSGSRAFSSAFSADFS